VSDYDDDMRDLVQDIEAERYVLAAMMAHPSAIEAAAEAMEEESFFRPQHKIIFRTLVLMYAAGDRVDPVTLRVRLVEDGEGKALGADGLYTAGLFELPAVPAMMGAYVRAVIRCAVRRRMIELGTRMVSKARAGDVDEAALVDSGHQILDRVLTAGGGVTASMPVLGVDEVADSDDVADPVIEGLLNRYERVLCVGPPGSGKSVLSLQMAFTTAAGCGAFAHTTRHEPRQVMVMDFENPPHIVHRRFRTFREIAQGYPAWDSKHLGLLHKPGGVNLTASRDAYGVAQQIKASGASLVVAGPLYKMLSGTKRDLEAYDALSNFWDRMREDFGIALWLEAHPPFGAGLSAKRDMRPEGSNVWEKWPEFGVGLTHAPKKLGGGRGALVWGDFRGHREEGRPWPAWISRNRMPGSGWPWVANYDRGAGQRAFGDDA
jgi:replicative DNA helicase